jgi:predicted HTH domain antitoxin
MRTLRIHIPDNVDLSDQEASTALAAQLYEMGKLSLGQAAELAGYTKTTFVELLAKYNVSLFNYPPDELDSDIANAKNYHR